MRPDPPPPANCPTCGAEVPTAARACPECGACPETGWGAEGSAGALGLPDDSFDYEEFVRDEFGPGRVKPRGVRWFWWMAAAITLAAFLTLLLWR